MVTSLRYPKGQAFFDNSGNLLASGSITYSRGGLSTAQDVFSDAAGLVALVNPVPLNAAGRAVDGSAQPTAIYFKDQGFTYKEVIKNSAGTVLYTDDLIPAPVDPSAGISDFAKPLTEASADTSTTVTLVVADFGKLRLANTTSNSITYALPSAALVGNGKPIGVKKIAAANTVTLDADGADTIDGAATFAWTVDDRAFWIVSDGANWHVYASYLAALEAASDTVSGIIELAIQSEMETATDVLRAVTPGRQHFHPGHPKFWAYARVAGGLITSYNVTSITDHGTGRMTVTIATDFSSADWCCLITPDAPATTEKYGAVEAKTAGTVIVTAVNDTGAPGDPVAYNVVGFGDQ